MAFPTIPTTGANTLLTSVTATAGTTHTFPSLTTLDNASGDMLIAVIVLYQASATGNTFGSWGGGFTEFPSGDSSSATNPSIAMGCAYLVSDGTETGTFTVTSSISGRAAMILMSVKGAGSTVPEVAFSGPTTATAPNSPSLDPAGWGTEDTLWITVAGVGQTSLSGSWTGLAFAPTNYTDFVMTTIAGGDVIGACQAGIAFRHLNAASDDPGAFTTDTSPEIERAATIAVRPAAAVPQTVNVTAPTAAWSARALTLTNPATCNVTAATAAWSARALTVSVGAKTVNLVAPTAAWSARALTATGVAQTANITAAVSAWSTQLSVTNPATINLTAPTAAWSAHALTTTGAAQTINVTASATWSAHALVSAGAATINLTAPTAAWSAHAFTATGAAKTANITAATAAWSARVLSSVIPALEVGMPFDPEAQVFDDLAVAWDDPDYELAEAPAEPHQTLDLTPGVAAWTARTLSVVSAGITITLNTQPGINPLQHPDLFSWFSADFMSLGDQTTWTDVGPNDNDILWDTGQEPTVTAGGPGGHQYIQFDGTNFDGGESAFAGGDIGTVGSDVTLAFIGMMETTISAASLVYFETSGHDLIISLDTLGTTYYQIDAPGAPSIKPTITRNVWQLVLATISAGVLTVRVNGVTVGSGSTTFAGGTFASFFVGFASQPWRLMDVVVVKSGDYADLEEGLLSRMHGGGAGITTPAPRWTAGALSVTNAVTVDIVPLTANWTAQDFDIDLPSGIAPQTYNLVAGTAAWSARALTTTGTAQTVSLTAPTAAWSARALTATGAATVSLTAPTATWSARALTATGAAATRNLTAATATWSARALTATGAAATRNLTAATATWSARALDSSTNIQVNLTAPTATWSARALTTTGAAKTVSLTAPTATWSARPLTTTSAPRTVSLTAPTAAWSARALTTAGAAKIVSLAAPTATWSARTLTATGAASTRNLTAATATWSARALTTTNAATINLTAPTATWTARALTTTGVARTANITAATATWTARAFVVSTNPQANIAPATATWTARSLTATGVARTVNISAASATWSARALTFANPATVNITPATATWSARALAPSTNIQASITPATATWSARALTVTGVARTANLTPATAAWSARALTATGVARTANLTPATAAWAARPLSSTSAAKTTNIVAPSASWSARALSIAGVAKTANLAAAPASWSARALSTAGVAKTANISPAFAAWSATFLGTVVQPIAFPDIYPIVVSTIERSIATTTERSLGGSSERYAGKTP